MPTTVYVEGLPFDMAPRDAETELRTRLAGIPDGGVLGVRLATWHDSGRLRGYAHVDVGSSEAAAEAVRKLDKAEVRGRYLTATAAKERGGKPSAPPEEDDASRVSKRIFCKNVPYDATPEALRDLFGSFGVVDDVRIPTQDGKAKGMAYVDFASDKSALKAVRAARAGDGSVALDGRKLVLDYDEGGPRAGFHRDRSLAQAAKTLQPTSDHARRGEKKQSAGRTSAGDSGSGSGSRPPKRGLVATPNSSRQATRERKQSKDQQREGGKRARGRGAPMETSRCLVHGV